MDPVILDPEASKFQPAILWPGCCPTLSEMTTGGYPQSRLTRDPHWRI
jgi:hypothetical protein